MFLALSCLLFACKKDENKDTPDVFSGFDYLPLDSGNYWIYEWYEVSSTGYSSKVNWRNDTAVAVGDTFINGLLFKKLARNSYGSANYSTNYYRDSAGILLGITGIPFISSDAGFDTLHVSCNVVVPWQCVIYIMNHTRHDRIVPAGSFSVIDKKTGYIDNADKFCNGQNIRYTTQNYAKGVGMITDQVFYLSDATCRYYEARLVKYYVK